MNTVGSTTQREAAIQYLVCMGTETLCRFVKDPGLRQCRILVFDLSLKETKLFISTRTYIHYLLPVPTYTNILIAWGTFAFTYSP
jgi:hypothetical protein